MKHAGLFAFALLFVLAGQSTGGWWWPPTGGALIEPPNPTSSDSVLITLFGEWPDSCAPYDSAVSMMGNDIYFDVIADYPPDIMCLAVITGWHQARSVGPLQPGTYTVYARLASYGEPVVPGMYGWIAQFVVTDKQFVLSTQSLTVPEGASATFTVRLLKDPRETVNVTVARQSGDPDISVQSGASLTFDPCNYSVPQTVALAAAEDMDYLNGTAIISVTGPGYLTTKLVATESDKDLPSVLYIDIDANGNNNGESWSDAFTDLQDALSLATEYKEIQEVRVAQGTYRPAGPGGHRGTSFRLADSTVKGGYAGTGEPDPDARDIGLYQTILSGDLNGDDGPNFTNTSDNCKQIIKVYGEVVLDGFTISGGYEGSGAGMYNYRPCRLTVRNCTFRGNHATYGAAVYNNSGCDVEFIDCVFVGNRATDEGGAIYNNSSDIQLTRCVFAANRAKDGGAIKTGHYTNLILMNCTFSCNQATDDGGAMRIQHLTDAVLTNCIFWGNSDAGGTDESAQIHGGTGEHLFVNYCCIQGWTGTLVGMGNFSSRPLFADPNNHDYHLKSQAGRWDPNARTWLQDDLTSPCIDAGDMSSAIGHEPFPNGGIVNMGAYGGTAEASKSYFGKPLCETIVAGDVNGDCRVDSKDFAFIGLHWLENNTPAEAEKP